MNIQKNAERPKGMAFLSLNAQWRERDTNERFSILLTHCIYQPNHHHPLREDALVGRILHQIFTGSISLRKPLKTDPAPMTNL